MCWMSQNGAYLIGTYVFLSAKWGLGMAKVPKGWGTGQRTRYGMSHQAY